MLPVQTHSLLTEKHRAFGSNLDDRGDHQHQRPSQNNNQQGEDGVEHPLQDKIHGRFGRRIGQIQHLQIAELEQSLAQHGYIADIHNGAHWGAQRLENSEELGQGRQAVSGQSNHDVIERNADSAPDIGKLENRHVHHGDFFVFRDPNVGHNLGGGKRYADQPGRDPPGIDVSAHHQNP